MTSYAFDANYDSDDEEHDSKFHYDGKDISLFVIDVAQPMFDNIQSEENERNSPFDICLRVLDQVFREKIRRQMKDLNGIILYNTEKSPDPIGCTDVSFVSPSNCAVFIPIQKIEAETIRYIKSTRESDDYNDFGNRYGHSKNAKISDVLWLCNSVISHAASKIHSLTVYWFTNDDSPHPINSTEYNQAMAKAKDLQHLEMDFELCPMKRDMDLNNFYGVLMVNIMDTDDKALNVHFTMDELYLKESLLLHNKRSRALTYLSIEISDKAKFGVGVYSQISKTKEPRPVLVDRKSKEVIRSHRTYKYGKIHQDDDENEVEVNYDQKLTADKAVKYLEMGGRKIKFTPLEVYEMKQVMEPTIKILGFKPLESYNPLNHKRSGYFIYPSEKRIKGSATMFRALWQTLLDTNKIAYCVFSMRFKSNPELAVLIPQKEDDDMLFNDGFQLEFIPYSEDIRDVSKFVLKEFEENPEIDASMSKIASKLTIRYSNPGIFKNPAINKVFNKLEEVEFDEEPKDSEDFTVPNVVRQDDRIGAYVEKMSDILGGFAESAKRKATNSDDKPSKKVVHDINHELVLDLCKKNETKELSVPMLKEYLKSKNVSGISKLKKDELIAKVLEAS